jgi:hypothetical protein
MFQELRRHKPSVLYAPLINVWWDCLTPTTQNLYINFMESLTSSDPILVLMTVQEKKIENCSNSLQDLLGSDKMSIFSIDYPSDV